MADTDKQADEVELQPDGPDEPAPKRTEQHPALTGTEEGQAAEVEQRSADGAEGTRFVKVFVTDPGAEHNEPQHEANRAAVLNEAIQRGLHPRGEVRYEGSKDVTPEPKEPGRRTFPRVELTYSVDTIPAVVDHKPAETTTPRDQIVSDDGSTVTPTSKPAAGAARRAEAKRQAKTEGTTASGAGTAGSTGSRSTGGKTAAAKSGTTKTSTSTKG
ncbi:hypothetical protein [Saccharothrix xinjiangensis]|uniref:Uncharacterized protein n=1 Tax=Saccharothrix xinjiangensis TaxID=204798 RepID=A0ABV9XTJ8_9PSEU